jgi:hypothetical protein
MYDFEKLQIEAAELHRLTDEELNRIGPEWREHALRRQDERLEMHRRTAANERPILIDFESRGYVTNYVGALPEFYEDYSSLVPTIFHHLKRSYEDKVLESLARLLAHSAAFPLWRDLVAMYQKADKDSSPGLMTGLAVALSEQLMKSKSPEFRQEVIKLLRDRSRGETRLFFLDFFRRKRDKESLDLITELKDDPDLKKEISSWKR